MIDRTRGGFALIDLIGFSLVIGVFGFGLCYALKSVIGQWAWYVLVLQALFLIPFAVMWVLVPVMAMVDGIRARIGRTRDRVDRTGGH